MSAASPFFRLYARWRVGRLAAQHGAAVQQSQLMRLVRKASSTRFGRDHDFVAIRDVAGFQARVPLRRYEDFWADYWRPAFPRLQDCTWPRTIPYFALTSGTTTGRTKYIPCSHEMVRANVRAARDVLVHHFSSRPASRLFDGETLMLGGSTDLHDEAPGIRSGDLSGIQANEVPWWARSSIFPPRELALLDDWEDKVDRIARLSLSRDIRAITGTPSWLLVLFDRLAALRPGAAKRLVDVYPRLELVVHGGIDFKPYARRFSELLEGSRAELREVYAASEAFIAVADRGQGEGLRLIADNGVFYEFVPTEELGAAAPTRHWLADVEPDVDYAIVVSSCAGAWAYVVGDTVRFVETDPPRLLVTGRTSYVLSAFGEHLIDAEIEEAVAAAAAAIAASVADYCVAPVFPDATRARGGHRYVVEFVEGRPEAGRIGEFGAALDRRLCMLNADYGAHRAQDYGLLPPNIEVVGRGTFQAWMKKRGKLGGQHKVPRIINDPDLFADLLDFVATTGAGR